MPYYSTFAVGMARTLSRVGNLILFAALLNKLGGHKLRKYKRGILRTLTLFARMNPGKVEIDARGQVIWKDEKLGAFVVIATRIGKTTGEEVGDV